MKGPGLCTAGLHRQQARLACRDNVHLRGKEPAETKGRGKPRDLSKKAVLLSGPPGIGKTSSALILARWAHLHEHVRISSRTCIVLHGADEADLGRSPVNLPQATMSLPQATPCRTCAGACGSLG